MNNSVQAELSHLITPQAISFFSGKKILITGASGLIGNYLRKFFEQIQNSLETSAQIYLHTRTGNFISSPNSQSIILSGDLTNLERAYFKTLPEFDVIVHAATYGQPAKFLANKLSTIELNSRVVQELSSRLAVDGVFLFLSSSEVYSGLETPPFSEDQMGTTSPSHPRAAYIEGKRIGETIMNCLQEQCVESRFLSARLALAYGPGFFPTDNRVINELIMRAVDSGVVYLQDSGQAVRTYCYVLDAAEMLVGLLIHGRESVYNVGGKSRITISELGRTIADLTSSEFRTSDGVNSNHTESAPKDVWLDISRIQELLGKSDFVDLREGLRRTIGWYQNFNERTRP